MTAVAKLKTEKPSSLNGVHALAISVQCSYFFMIKGYGFCLSFNFFAGFNFTTAFKVTSITMRVFHVENVSSSIHIYEYFHTTILFKVSSSFPEITFVKENRHKGNSSQDKNFV